MKLESFSSSSVGGLKNLSVSLASLIRVIRPTQAGMALVMYIWFWDRILRRVDFVSVEWGLRCFIFILAKFTQFGIV